MRIAALRASSHPDVSKEPEAEAKFKELQEAYEVLKDPEKRALYNQLGENWRAGQDFRPPPDWGKGFEFSRGRGGQARRGPRDEGAAEFSDFFSELFGARSPFGRASTSGRQDFAAAGQDHMARVEIDLEDAYRGGTRMIELRTPELTSDGQLRMKPRTLRVSIPAGAKSCRPDVLARPKGLRAPNSSEKKSLNSVRPRRVDRGGPARRARGELEALAPIRRRPEVLAGAPVFTQLVVQRALFGILEDLVRFLQLLELCLGLGLLADVGMVLARKAAIRTLDDLL